MKDTSKFIREYKRASKSPWCDSSTLLLLADIDLSDDNALELSFNRYIYLHRDSVGRAQGTSISKAMLDTNPDFSGRYLEGVEMYALLLLYVDEITEFCDLFADEFESVFLIPPRDYFEVAELRWYGIINNA